MVTILVFSGGGSTTRGQSGGNHGVSLVVTFLVVAAVLMAKLVGRGEFSVTICLQLGHKSYMCTNPPAYGKGKGGKGKGGAGCNVTIVGGTAIMRVTARGLRRRHRHGSSPLRPNTVVVA